MPIYIFLNLYELFKLRDNSYTSSYMKLIIETKPSLLVGKADIHNSLVV